MTTEDAGRELDEFRRLREQVTDDRRDALIRRAYAEGMNIRQIGVRMGVSRSTVYRVLGLGPVPAVSIDLSRMPRTPGICHDCGRDTMVYALEEFTCRRCIEKGQGES